MLKPKQIARIKVLRYAQTASASRSSPTASGGRVSRLVFLFCSKKKHIVFSRFLEKFSTDLDNFWTGRTRKKILIQQCIFCGLSHVRFSDILKKPVFLQQYNYYYYYLPLYKIPLWFLDRFWSSVPQNSRIFMFFQIPVFLWSFPCQNSALALENRISASEP